MLRDHDIQKLAGQLRSVDRESQKHHENLGNLLQNFHSLLDSYNLLKSDYEEEKDAREKYKKMARGQERNPFVLVLVDGDGYLFKEDLIKSRGEGGILAARLMTDSIKELLHDRLGDQADQCSVMIRIYSNLAGLSKTLARAGLAGNEARSFAGFASSFTRSQDLADYVDAGEKKEGADYKIREMFRLFADSHQCKHIFFAGCHDTGYLSMLTPYHGMADHITLLKGASFHPEFRSLGLSISELPSVFMSTPIGAPPVSSAPKQVVCKHFQKGICKYGNGCAKQHVRPQQEIIKPQDDTKNWTTSTPARKQDDYASMLPAQNIDSEKYIALNKNGDRLDTYFPAPSDENWVTYTRRIKQQRLCNRYHLGGECGDMNCQFYHGHVDDTLLTVMRYIMRQHPCQRGTSCRSIKCYMGHICQKNECKGRQSCRFNVQAHILDLKVAHLVVPVEDYADAPVSENSEEEDIMFGSNNSFVNSTKRII